MTDLYLNSGNPIDIFPLSSGSSGNPTTTCVITGVNAPAGSDVFVFVAEGGAVVPGTMSDGTNQYQLAVDQAWTSVGAVFRAAKIPAALSNATITYTKRAASHNCVMTAMVALPKPGFSLTLDPVFGATAAGSGTAPVVMSDDPSQSLTLALGAVFYSSQAANIACTLSPLWSMPPYLRNSYPDAQVAGGFVISGSTKHITFVSQLSQPSSWVAMIVGLSVTPAPTKGWYGVRPWRANTTFSAGDLVRQNAIPGYGLGRVFQSGGGTSGAVEPAWNLGKGAITIDGNNHVLTEVTGTASDRPFPDLLAAALRLNETSVLHVDDDSSEVWGPSMTNTRYSPTFPTVVPIPRIFLGDSWLHVLPSVVAATTVNNCNFHGAGYFEGGNIRLSEGAVPYSISNNYEGMEKFKGTKFYISNLLIFGWDNNGPAYADDCTFVGEPYIGNSSVAAIQLSHGAKIRRAKFSGRWNSAYLFAAYQTAQPGGTVSDSDLSGVVGVTGSLVQQDRSNNSMGNSGYRFERCELPVALAVGQNKFGIENMIDIIECGPAVPVRRLERWTGQGSHVRDRAIVRHGGATSSCVPVSWRFNTTPFISWPLPFYSIELPSAKLIPVGSIVHATVYGVIGISAPALQSNAQLWTEFMLLDPDEGFGQVVSTGIDNSFDPQTPLQSDPSSAWSGVSINSFAFKMTVIVGGVTKPQIATAVVKCSVPNVTFWIDPKVYPT